MPHETWIRHADANDMAVLFLHGFLGSPKHFTQLASLVPEHIGVYNLLLAGHGKKVRDFGKASMKQWKEQVEAVVQDLEQRYRRLVIVGHSMGTFFAMEQAVKRPDFVESVLLLQTPLKICVKPESAKNTFRSLFSLFGTDEKAIAYKNAHGVELNFKVWEYIGWIPRYIELFRESVRMRKVIGAVSVPCCIFQSKRDELVSLKSLQFVPKRENFQICILEKSAHFIYDKTEFSEIEAYFLNLIG